MDCSRFDAQVVRLEKIKDLADEFVRVRLAEIESLDLKVFDFDFDLTFVVLFMDSDQRILSRYGGRCEQGPDARQSLDGLRYTMSSVLKEFRSAKTRVAPRQIGKPFHIREIAPPRGLGRCIHCHQAKEVIYDNLNRKGKWNNELAFRYPLPENIGVKVEVDRSNVVEQIVAESSSEKAGLKVGDKIIELDGVPIHSAADIQFALDRAPKHGSLSILYETNAKQVSARIALQARWRRTDISWRPSLKNFVASARVYGKDLNSAERRKLGLNEKQLAFIQKKKVSEQARKAGIRAGDIVLGFDDHKLEMNAYDFLLFVRGNYVKGETVKVNIVRNGKRMTRSMNLE